MPAILYSISAGLLAPQGIAVGNGVLAVADTGHNQIAFFDLATLPAAQPTRVGGPGTDPAVEGLRLPAAVAFPAPGALVAADTFNGQLDRYALVANGWAFQGSVSPGAALIPNVVSDGTGLLVLDAPGKRVLRLNPVTGAVTVHYADPQWQDPAALAVGGGYLWIADAMRHQVFRYDAGFTRLALGGYGAGPGRLRAPRGVVFDTASGGLYVTEAEGNRISCFDVAGAYRDLIPMPGGFHQLHKVALAADRLYVADAGANLVYVVDLTRARSRPGP